MTTKTMTELLSDLVQQIDYRATNEISMSDLSTGFDALDNLTAGMQRGDLIIIGARPSIGKTTFVMNIVEHVAIKQQKPVLWFSMEMPTESIVTRMVSSLGRIRHQAVRSGNLDADEWDRLSQVVSLLTETRLSFIDTPQLTATQLCESARAAKEEDEDLALVVVDYLQLMHGANENQTRTAQLSEITRELKGLALELDITIIVTSQLTRELEHRPNKRPLLLDLRDSGSIEEDADVVIFIYRDEVYNKDTEERGIAEIIAAKHRNGGLGTAKVAFIGDYCSFENLVSSD